MHHHKSKKDKDVVLVAINQYPDAIKYIHEDIKRDTVILIATGMYDENYVKEEDQQTMAVQQQDSQQQEEES